MIVVVVRSQELVMNGNKDGVLLWNLVFQSY